MKTLRLPQMFTFPCHSLAQKHLAVFLLVSLLPLLLVCTLIVLQQISDGQKRKFDQLESMNGFRATLIHLWYANLEENLNITLLAHQADILHMALTPPSPLQEADARKKFNSLLQLNPDVDQIFLLGKNGAVLAGSNGVRIGEMYNAQAWFKHGLNRLSTQIETPFRPSDNAIRAVVTALPVEMHQGTGIGVASVATVAGVLCARTSLNHVNRLISLRPNPGNTGETLIVNEDHVLLTVVPPNPAVIPGTTLVHSEGISQVLLSHANAFLPETTDYRGNRVVAAYHWLPDLQAILITKQDIHEAYRSIDNAVYTSLIVGLLTIIATGAIALLFSRMIIRPVIHLSHVATRISNGELDMRIKSASRDEVGQLARAFDHMAAHLAELIKTQQQQITQLEQAHGMIESKTIALEKQSAFLNAVIDNVPVALFAKDARDKFRFTLWNGAAAKMFQIGPEAIIGKLTHELWPKEQADASLLADITVARSKQRVDITSETARIADGSEIVLHTIKVPIINRLDGQTDYLLGVSEDITARSQADRTIHELNATLERRVIERTAQLEVASEALKAFNYSVAHDLRAPLRGIDGWSQALLEDCHAQLDEQGQQYLQRIRSDTQRMAQLIDDLLRLSKVSSAPMKIGTVDLSDMATQILRRLQEAAPNRQVECSIQAGLTLQGDQNLLEIALTNLLDNAWKFTAKMPHAKIEVGCNRGEEKGGEKGGEKDGEAAFFVRDNGAGFDMHYAQNLFSPFQRLHTQQEFAGNGIGLATVQRIFQRHGGRVWVEAEVGKGATFYFQIRELAD